MLKIFYFLTNNLGHEKGRNMSFKYEIRPFWVDILYPGYSLKFILTQILYVYMALFQIGNKSV